MKDLDHVERPQLPWRDERLTECGLDVSHQMITRREFYGRVKEQGQQRAAMGICMTCWSTAQRHAGFESRRSRSSHADLVNAFVNVWDYDPMDVLTRQMHGDHRDRLNRELQVIALLIAAHREEFNEALRSMDDAPSLADLRNRKTARQQYLNRSRR